MILTRRAARLKHHPGQVAFPGGKLDPTDPTPLAAAIAHHTFNLQNPKSKGQNGCRPTVTYQPNI